MSASGTPLIPSAFTVRYNGRSNRLIAEVEIFPAHAYGTTPQQGKKYKALFDTGATHSSITPKVVADFNLPSIRAMKVGVGGGELDTTSHLVNIALPNRVMFQMMPVAKMVLLGGIDALIGMDILGIGDFALTHQNGRTTFSFCCPSRREIDFVGEVQATKAIASTALSSTPTARRIQGRNEPCNCGSGKKFKKCHGLPA